MGVLAQPARRAFSRSNSPGRCTRQLGQETSRSMPYHRDPACCFASSPITTKAPKEVSSHSGFRSPGTPAGQRHSRQGLHSPFRTQYTKNQREAWDPPLCRLVGVCCFVFFDGLLQGFDRQTDAVLLLVRNLNQTPKDIPVLDVQSLGKGLSSDEIGQSHGG